MFYMITFINDSKEEPFKKFKEEYERAVIKNQDIIEAISVSSFCQIEKIVDARFVNLKIIDNNEFIFFSNYNSPKADQFASHSQIAVSIYWAATNIQIRIKAEIKKKSHAYNKKYFAVRSIKKNALAISSNQSKPINSYAQVKKEYLSTLDGSKNLNKCPLFWGGFSFTPYYFEFWEGHESRLNKRDSYEIQNGKWQHSILQP